MHLIACFYLAKDMNLVDVCLLCILVTCSFPVKLSAVFNSNYYRIMYCQLETEGCILKSLTPATHLQSTVLTTSVIQNGGFILLTN